MEKCKHVFKSTAPNLTNHLRLIGVPQGLSNNDVPEFLEQVLSLFCHFSLILESQRPSGTVLSYGRIGGDTKALVPGPWIYVDMKKVNHPVTRNIPALEGLLREQDQFHLQEACALSRQSPSKNRASGSQPQRRP
jgi:hypothetical protein